MTTTRSQANPLNLRTALLAVPVAAPAGRPSGLLADVDARLGGVIARAVRDGEVTGAAGETTVFHAAGPRRGPSRIVLIGTGGGSADELRRAGGAIAKVAARLRCAAPAVHIPDGMGGADAAAMLAGIWHGAYRFDRFRSGGDGDSGARTRVTSLTVTGAAPDPATLAALDVRARRIDAARDLANTPANHLAPPALADYAAALAGTIPGLECTIMGPKELTKLGAGAMLAVAQGSANPARMIVLRWAPKAAPAGEVLGLVGKAVTFDTGGISIKPAGGMEEMKADMSGGAAVIEGIAAIAQLQLPVSVMAVVPAVENMPDGAAVKPGDVVSAMNGKTIEVINTDAEGRLILADALTWAARNGATRLVDFATLTGAMVIALGEVYAGLFGSDVEWTERVRAAGDASGDIAWPLPLHEGYRPLIASGVADLSNAAKKRQAGGVYAAMFLREFTDGLPWCHLDIAGTAFVNGAATGTGVGLITRLAESLCAD